MALLLIGTCTIACEARGRTCFLGYLVLLWCYCGATVPATIHTIPSIRRPRPAPSRSKCLSVCLSVPISELLPRWSRIGSIHSRVVCVCGGGLQMQHVGRCFFSLSPAELDLTRSTGGAIRVLLRAVLVLHASWCVCAVPYMFIYTLRLNIYFSERRREERERKGGRREGRREGRAVKENRYGVEFPPAHRPNSSPPLLSTSWEKSLVLG